MDIGYRKKDGKILRYGFTTGSCAAAAAKAALLMLLEDCSVEHVQIRTPKGTLYTAEITDIQRTGGREGFVSCAVTKDAGDDPDITNGIKIFARVELIPERDREQCEETALHRTLKAGRIRIIGGEGIGRVTKPGLDQPVGEAAINSVPRSMIVQELTKVLADHGHPDAAVQVTISAPMGEAIARKTFNPKLGIVGGISILGTTGIVEPMSDVAMLETIRLQAGMQLLQGKRVLITAPGNYGLEFLQAEYGIPEDEVVLISNFVYDAVRICAEGGFEKLLLAGHLGKLVKVAGGEKNTHSAFGDRRMEILSELVGMYGEGEDAEELKRELQECVTTDEALRRIEKAGLKEQVLAELVRRIKRHLEDWSEGRLEAEVIVFANDRCAVKATPGAAQMLAEWRGDC